MDFIVYLAVAIVAFWIGYHVRGIIILANLAANPDKIIKMLEKIKEINQAEETGLPVDAVEVEAEVVNNVVYAYDKQTGQFLAQSNDLVDALTIAAKRFPGKSFWHPDVKQSRQTT